MQTKKESLIGVKQRFHDQKVFFFARRDWLFGPSPEPMDA
jgi:hypothetical protein